MGVAAAGAAPAAAGTGELGAHALEAAVLGPGERAIERQHVEQIDGALPPAPHSAASAIAGLAAAISASYSARSA